MVQQFTIHQAKAHLSRLIDAALAGEEIVILKDGKPAVRLVAVPQAGFKIGFLKGKLGFGPDFLEPMSESDLRMWDVQGSLIVQVKGEAEKTYKPGDIIYEPGNTVIEKFDNGSATEPAIFIADYLLGAEKPAK